MRWMSPGNRPIRVCRRCESICMRQNARGGVLGREPSSISSTASLKDLWTPPRLTRGEARNFWRIGLPPASLAANEPLSAREHAGIPPYESAGGPSTLTIPLRATPLNSMDILGSIASAPHHVSRRSGRRAGRPALSPGYEHNRIVSYEIDRPPTSARTGYRCFLSSRASPLTRFNALKTSCQDEMALRKRSQRPPTVREDSLASKNMRLCRVL